MSDHELPSRRQSDRVLNMILDNQREERERAESYRDELLRRTEPLPVIVKLVDQHETRLTAVEATAKTSEKRLDRVKYIAAGMFGTGGIGGTALGAKFLAWLGITH